jgi:hypothetical protein
MTDSKIQELMALISPPELPADTTVDWTAAEGDLGLPLPTDYKEFISYYGSVDLCGVIYVFHPKRPLYGKSMKEESIEVLDKTINCMNNGRENLSYPDYPAAGGILPIARIYENLLCWITNGPPDTWRLLYWGTFGTEVYEYKMTLTEFLIEVFNERMKGLVGSFFVGFDSPNRKATAAPVLDYLQPPDEYYRNQKNS